MLRISGHAALLLVTCLACSTKPAAGDAATSAAPARASAEPSASAESAPTAVPQTPASGTVARMDASALAEAFARSGPGTLSTFVSPDAMDPDANDTRLSKAVRTDGRPCITEEMKKAPGDGKRSQVKIEVSLGADGTKKEVKVIHPSKELAACLASAIEKVTFGPPKKGEETVKLEVGFSSQ